ncbi:hypothetical protein K435DRAFT_239645 [Dendrothele bispora CBS 962.96]|uniref:Uncharacterized protein n=1 Tax=Dendrothele bispora (strain CBS 962.96) TaxID=1314807 RepID=A0A4V4HHS8_DENBC|nr:hypothetical protein K435DRAFT_239645 [Dendrothele bispora CBS 962.96]
MENVHLSSQIAESFANFSKEIHKTFEEAERKARQDIARSVADALEARNERDNANRLLHEAQMETQQWKQEVMSSNAQLKQSETILAHHLETIALLKRECNQWKDQSKNWQEHFLRVEQERCGLASKLDELNDRLHTQSTMGMAPLTPISRYADHDIDDARKSHPSALPLSPPEPDTPSATRVKDVPLRPKKTPNPRTLSSRSQPSSTKRSHAAPLEDDSIPSTSSRKSVSTNAPHRLFDDEGEMNASESHGPQSRLIRRVTAIVPVKQEDFEKEESFNGSQAEEEEEDEEEDGDGEYIESPPKRRISKPRPPKQATKRTREPSEDATPEESEDDELMISSQKQLQDTHTPSHKRRPPTPGPGVPSTKRRKSNTGPAPKNLTKKRT